MHDEKLVLDVRTCSILLLLRTLIENEEHKLAAGDRSNDGLVGQLQRIKAEIERMLGFTLEDFTTLSGLDEQWNRKGDEVQAVMIEPEGWREGRMDRVFGVDALLVPKSAYALALELEQVRAKLAGLEKLTGVEPIETAPKDGTEIDLYTSLAFYPQGKWMDGAWHYCTSYWSGERYLRKIEQAVTHWRKRPEIGKADSQPTERKD